MNYEQHNNRLLSELKSGTRFHIVAKATTFPKLEGDYCEVIWAEEPEWVDWYSMVLVHDEPTTGGDWDVVNGEPTEGLGYSLDEYRRIKDNWLPLPVLFEMLGIEWEWGMHDPQMKSSTAKVRIAEKLEPFAEKIDSSVYNQTIKSQKTQRMSKKTGQVFA